MTTSAVLAQPLPAPTPTLAASPRAKEEARQRFDRGLSLYNTGDMQGALAEFTRAYALTRHPVVLYNLALVRANVGESASAVGAFEALKQSGWTELGPERAERAETVYREQLRRVGTLVVRADVNGALLLVDNVDAARTPAPPLRVTAGQHVVALSAPGYEPRRLVVSVAGEAEETVSVTLLPLEAALSRLEITSSVPDVTVFADGVPLGRTPFPTEIALRPGPHELAWTRDGYVPGRRHVELSPGTRGAISAELSPSTEGLTTGGVLAVHASEPNAVIAVDGSPLGSVTTRLPAGRHSIRIRRAGFFDVDRDIAIHAGANSLDVTLLPTPEYLGDYVSHAKTMRLVSYVALGAGALIAGGSVGFLVWNQGKKTDAKNAFDDHAASVRSNPNGTCPTRSCEEALRILADDLDSKRSRDAYGWAGIGVGAAALGAGGGAFCGGGGSSIPASGTLPSAASPTARRASFRSSAGPAAETAMPAARRPALTAAARSISSPARPSSSVKPAW